MKIDLELNKPVNINQNNVKRVFEKKSMFLVQYIFCTGANGGHFDGHLGF